MKPPRSGITLIELVLVLGALLFLLGLALPVLFRVRQVAELERGRNNLREIVLGVHNFHDAQGRFPPIAGIVGGVHGSILFHLLPYVEQIAVYREGSVWTAGTIGKPLDVFLDPRDKSAP